MSQTIWILVPAAGVGSRMQADRPKQYLHLLGKPVIEHTLDTLRAVLPDAEIVIGLNPEDPYWPELHAYHRTVTVVDGGAERCDTVLNGLKHIADRASADDWVMVHDVARPCVRREDILNLVQQIKDDPVGGLLALPVADTMKRAAFSDHPDTGKAKVASTVDRSHLWHALTPQVFRYALLRDSLVKALEEEVTITDEASAIEWAGYQPVLVKGQRDNLKITHPDDLWFAELFLKARSADRD